MRFNRLIIEASSVLRIMIMYARYYAPRMKEVKIKELKSHAATVSYHNELKVGSLQTFAN